MLELADVMRARESLGRWVRRTPLARSPFLSGLCNGEVCLKLENRQVTNSFKIRGAFNRMLGLSARDRKRGIVTASAGNHGLAVAVAAEELKVKAKIVVPANAPKVKTSQIEKHNVELLRYGSIYDEAERRALDIATEDGLTYLSPYNDRLVVAGQGTVGLEILEDAPDLNSVIVPVGGGGLISGIAVTVRELRPHVQILGVQSEASPAMYESVRAGEIVDVETKESIADGLVGGIQKGAITFEIVQRSVDRLLLVKERSIREAIRILWEEEGQAVEGAGATAIAPILENPRMFERRKTVAVITGGNI
ncbi:MAG: threonine/serine dehydratase, partial [Candidatus Bathyarchaeota archaeon]|nr:threonine/serine dehydratase [Candidatus Bathyarchaeota archaeon]